MTDSERVGQDVGGEQRMETFDQPPLNTIPKLQLLLPKQSAGPRVRLITGSALSRARFVLHSSAVADEPAGRSVGASFQAPLGRPTVSDLLKSRTRCRIRRRGPVRLARATPAMGPTAAGC